MVAKDRSFDRFRRLTNAEMSDRHIPPTSSSVPSVQRVAHLGPRSRRSWTTALWAGWNLPGRRFVSLGADIGLTIVATLAGFPASVVTRSFDVVLHPVHESQIRLDRCRLCRLPGAEKFFERTRSCDVCVDLSPLQRHARPASSIAQTSLAPSLPRVTMAECGHVFMTS